MATLAHSTICCRKCRVEKTADQFYQRLTRYGLPYRDKDCKACTKLRIYAAKARAIADLAEAERRRLRRRDHKRRIRSGTYTPNKDRHTASASKRAKRAEIDLIRGQHDAHVKRWRRACLQRRANSKWRSTTQGILENRMGVAIFNALRDKKRGRKWESLVGYSLPTLMAHIEKQFTKGMSWANIGAWHIDHRLPRSMFKYQSADDPGFKECWALTNLQPLWAKDNLSKNDRRTVLI